MIYDEIINKEKRQSLDDLLKIHLYLENDWWRAYEWSAYLCNIFPNNLDENNKLRPTHKNDNSHENGIILVGLKQSSFAKYFPNVIPSIVGEKHMVMDVSEQMREFNLTLETYNEKLIEWKKTIPIKQENEKTKQTANQITTSKSQGKSNIMAVMQEVLAYPIENKTLIENTMFISHLKSELIKLI